MRILHFRRAHRGRPRRDAEPQNRCTPNTRNQGCPVSGPNTRNRGATPSTFLFFFLCITLGLEMSDTQVYEP